MKTIGLDGPIQCVLLPGPLRVRLLSDFHVGHKGQLLFSIPKGFETDFASVPQVFWNILPPTGRYSEAAVVHDYLYAFQACTRKEADDIFLFLMELLQVSYWKRKIMYRAVRTFGWHTWNEYSQKNNSKKK